MKKEPKDKALFWIGIVIGLVGLAVLFDFDFKVMVGVFLLIWGNNITGRAFDEKPR